MLKIGVLVSGGGTNLQAIIDACQNKRIKNGEIAIVIASRPDAHALDRAKEAGIKAISLPRKNYTSVDEYSMKLVESLRECEVDLVVLAGFLTITGRCFVEAFRDRVINVHPALIPSFAGKGFYGIRVHEAALSRGVKLTGATVHFVNEECDGGPIILQRAIPVLEDDTPQSLQKRVMEKCEWELLVEAIDLFCNKRLEVKDNVVYIKERCG